jgi:uncharacterized membrane protein YgaE (UPF0421/DUF939 family)
MRETSTFHRLRRFLTAAANRLKSSLWSILQTAIAASAAYFLALVLLGHQQPFFAPIAAVVTLSITLGHRGRRAVELAIGVAVGLVVAGLIVFIIGTGPARIGLVVALAMVAAVVFSGRSLLVNQAAISAILVVVLQSPDTVFFPARLLDALVGGGVALAVNHLFPVNPERVVEQAARPIFDELVTVLEEIATALEIRDLERAEWALWRSREVDERVKGFDEALSAGHEAARLSPTRRRSLKHLELYASASIRMELTVINVRVLARGAANAVRRGDVTPPLIPKAVLDLARAVGSLAAYLEESEGSEEARQFALKAAQGATEALKERHDLATSVLVGQVRSAAVDILRSTGLDQASALSALEEAAGRASEIG